MFFARLRLWKGLSDRSVQRSSVVVWETGVQGAGAKAGKGELLRVTKLLNRRDRYLEKAPKVNEAGLLWHRKKSRFFLPTSMARSWIAKSELRRAQKLQFRS